MRAASDPITELRRAIDCLPVRTREAMLHGIRTNPIIVGAYTDNDGGICPMLAAHRHGGRTTLLAFARSWDAFSRTSKVRRASRREIAVLEAQLEASLLAEDHVDLKAAIADHEAIKQRNAIPEIGARKITTKSISRLRPARARAQDAERALERLHAMAVSASGPLEFGPTADVT